MAFSLSPEGAKSGDVGPSHTHLNQHALAPEPQRSPATTRSSTSPAFDGLTVFSATTSYRRDSLGEDITEWLRQNPELTPVNTVIRLSSDARYHCLSILVFWRASRP